MAKSERRPTLREQVDKLKHQNKALRRALQKARRDFFQMARMNDDAHRDFVKLTRVIKQRSGKQREANEILDRAYNLLASLELATRDPTMPLQ